MGRKVGKTSVIDELITLINKLVRNATIADGKLNFNDNARQQIEIEKQRKRIKGHHNSMILSQGSYQASTKLATVKISFSIASNDWGERVSVTYVDDRGHRCYAYISSSSFVSVNIRVKATGESVNWKLKRLDLTPVKVDEMVRLGMMFLQVSEEMP